MPSKVYSYKSQSVACCLLYKCNKGETLQNLGAVFIWHLQGLNTAYYCVLKHRQCFTESSAGSGSLTSGEKAKLELVANHIGICSIRSCRGNVSIPASSAHCCQPIHSNYPSQMQHWHSMFPNIEGQQGYQHSATWFPGGTQSDFFCLFVFKSKDIWLWAASKVLTVHFNLPSTSISK